MDYPKCSVCGAAYKDDSCRSASNPSVIRGFLAPVSQEEMDEKCTGPRIVDECQNWRR